MLFIMVGMIVMFCVLSLNYISYKRDFSSLEKKQEALEKRLALIRKGESDTDNIVQTKRDLKNLKIIERRFYNPASRMAVLEAEKPKTVFFTDIYYDRKKELIRGVIVTKNYSDVEQYLSKVEKNKLFRSATLDKKGAAYKSGVSYYVTFDISDGMTSK